MGRFNQYIKWFNTIRRYLWVKIISPILFFVGLYDLFISQFIPERFSKSAPKTWAVIIMSGNLLPFWGWLLIFAAIFVIATIEYSIHPNKEKNELLNSYAYSLVLEGISAEVYPLKDKNTSDLLGRHIIYKLDFKNALDRPIHYEVTKMDINDVTQTHFATTGGIIGASSAASFASPEIDFPVSPINNSIETSTMFIEIQYGPPDCAPIRRVTKQMNIRHLFEVGRVSFIYTIDKEESI